MLGEGKKRGEKGEKKKNRNVDIQSFRFFYRNKRNEKEGKRKLISTNCPRKGKKKVATSN